MQQLTLDNQIFAIKSINQSMVVTESMAKREPFKLVSRDIIPYEVIKSSYRVSYFLGSEHPAADASGFTGIGSAMAYNNDPQATSTRTLMSCAHLFSDDPDYTKYRIDIFNDDGVLVNRIPFKVIKISGTLDLSQLVVEQDLPHFSKFESLVTFHNLKVGDSLYMVGASAGLTPYHIQEGRLTSKSVEGLPDLYQFSAICMGGHSGGGVYDQYNNFVGVLVRGGGNISIFVPLTTVVKFLAE